MNFESEELSVDSVKTKFLVLHVPENIFLSVPDQMEHDEKSIYLLYTIGNNAGLYVFDKLTGEFIKKIGNKGRGKGEYILPLSVTLDKNSIYVVDGGEGAVLRYSKKSYQYIEKIENVTFGCFEFVNDSLCITDNCDYNQRSEYSGKSFLYTKGKFTVFNGVVKKVISSGYQTGPVKSMYSFDEGVRAYTQFSPYIYDIGIHGAYPKYQIAFRHLSFPPQDYMRKISRGGKDYIGDLRRSGYISYLQFHETESNLLAFCMVSSKRYVGLYNKFSSKSCFLSEADLAFLSPIVPFQISGTFDNSFAAVFPVMDILDGSISSEILSYTSENDLVIQMFWI